MTTQLLPDVLRHVRKLAAVQTGRRLTDGELLVRFVGGNDEAAFTLLVERHGPMVFGVCRRALGCPHDAEDACQATFLVLARKAAALGAAASISGWLHGVACRVAANLKRQRRRRVCREHGATPAPPTDSAAEVAWRELVAALDEELARLPERQRAALVLCYLDGRTRDEAAGLLGVTLGRLHGLLERGRALLRRRLVGRGLALPAALLSAAVAGARPPLASTAVIVTARAARLLHAGQPAHGVVADHVLTLAREVTQGMFLTQLKIGTAAVLGAVVLLTAASFAARGLAQAPKADAKPPPTAKGESDEVFLRRISKDLRGHEPSPAEVHFFVASREANKRQKAIDLFIQERQASKAAEAKRRAQGWAVELTYELDRLVLREWVVKEHRRPRLASLQATFFKELSAAAAQKKDAAAITQGYLDQLLKYVKEHPRNADVADAIKQIILLYQSQGKAVEAGAWRDKLKKEYPTSTTDLRKMTRSMFLESGDVLVDELWVPLEQGQPAKK